MNLMLRRILTAILLPLTLSSQAADFVEEFDTLDKWQALTFPKVPKHSTYKAVQLDGVTAVELAADASASALNSVTTFAPAKTPYLSFRWKVEQIWDRGDATKKAGDDYPVRIYVAFVYDPKKASFKERITYGAAKLRLGEYPPHSSLNYVWANRSHKSRILASPYTERSQLIIQDSGTADVGSWQTHTVNILDDYRKAFGKLPPASARLAIMIDADNTADKGRAWIDYVRLSDTPPKN